MKRSIRILLAEDKEDYCQFFETLLETDGAVVVRAENYHEALKLLDDPDEEYDISLVDRCMPGMDGLYLLEMIKEKSGDMPVIMMSAFWTEELKQKANNLGADLVMDKLGFEYWELREAIISLVEKGRQKKNGNPKG